MKNLIESIGKKIQIFIPTLVFFLIFIKTFAEKYSDQGVANGMYLDLGSLVAFYIIFYAVYLFFENSDPDKNPLLSYVDQMLKMSFLLVGVYLLILSLMNNAIVQKISGLTHLGPKIISLLGVISIVILFIIIILSIFALIMFVCGFKKSIKTNKIVLSKEDMKRQKIKDIWKEKYVFAIGTGALMVAFQNLNLSLGWQYWALIAAIFLSASGYLTGKTSK